MDNNHPAYFIAGIRIDTKQERTENNVVGFYYSFEEASQAVLNNANDVWDNYYQYMVIEELLPGVAQGFMAKELQWYKMSLDDKSKGYRHDNLIVEKCSKPEVLYGYQGWSLA